MPKILCTRCGASIDDTSKFCQNCGAPVAPAPSAQAAPPQQHPPGPQPQQPPPSAGPSSSASSAPYSTPYTYPYGQQTYGQPPYAGNPAYPPYQSPYQGTPYGQPGTVVPPGYQPRNRIAAGLLAILVGCLGVHNFYLGFTGRALAQLLMTILSCGILAVVSQIWAIVEGIQILTGHMVCDARGVPMVT